VSNNDAVSAPADRITFLERKENSLFVDAKEIDAGLTTESVTF